MRSSDSLLPPNSQAPCLSNLRTRISLTLPAKSMEPPITNIESLKKELCIMQRYLQDENEDHTRTGIRSDSTGEAEMLAHRVEDLITKFQETDMNPTKRGIYLLQYRYRRRRDLKIITREIQALKDMLPDINFNVQTACQNAQLEVQEASFHDSIEMHDTVGLQKDANELIKDLTDTKFWPRLVISIVGMGGIGKSTLAKKIFNHKSTQDHFDFRVWILMTQFFDHKDLLIKVLSTIEKTEEHELRHWTVERLRKQLNKSLSARSCLIVLDNVWGAPHQSGWDYLLKALADVRKNSRVILTTRINELAAYAHPTYPPFKMKHLGNEDSWELFCKEASIDHNDVEIQDIGRHIVRRCGGLPISIKDMGSIFKGEEKKKKTWDEKLKKMDSLQGIVRQTLELSYNSLKPELKNCFLLVGFFPENYTIRARTLIHFWIAEGLITGQEGETVEDVAESHLDTLVNTNMIQSVEVSSDGRIKTCKIDNSFRELCILKAKKEILLQVQDRREFMPSRKKHHHRAIHCSIDRYFDSQDSCPLRSLVCFVPNATISFAQLESICKRFTLLKILHLEGMIVEYLPEEVGKLRDLRYLNLRSTRIDQLPASMIHLTKLLALDIRDNTYLKNLDVVSNMTNLQNLYLPKFSKEFNLSELCKLKILKKVKVTSVESLKCLASLTVLQTLELQLGVNLFNINFLEQVKEMTCLESLCIYPEMGISSLATDKLQGVKGLPSLEDFQPNLIQLTPERSALIPFPLAELGKLQNLSSLKLRNLYIKGQKLRFSGGGFRRLKYLELADLWNLKALELQGNCALSTLKHLKISNCIALNSLPEEIKNLKSFSELEINRMRETFEKKIRRYTKGLPITIKFTNTVKDR